ncbi:hypothetical protein EGW08_014075, partial [Elysia chlorotica]
MCWLYRACVSVTYGLEEQTCLLYRVELDGDDYRTTLDSGSLAVNMRHVTMAPSKIARYGCGKRPCLETEMCAPVKNIASHICIPLISVFCRDDPPEITDSEPSYDGISSVSYACADGYFRSGNSYISSCDLDTGTWTSVDVTCSKVDCLTPPILHGAVSTDQKTTADSVVTYSCLDGSVPVPGQIQVTCQGSTGQWSPLQGSCKVVTCDQPKAVDKAQVELTPRSLDSAYPGMSSQDLLLAYGAEAVYTCIAGYIPVEGATYISQCQADGTWSPTETFLCSPVDCGVPPNVTNSTPPAINTATTFGENVTLGCLRGFSPLVGLTFTCDVSGRWVGTMETCTPLDCGDPPAVENATVSFNGTGLSSIALYECIQPAVVEREDNSTSMCQENEEWSPVGVTCIPVPCGDAPSANNTDVTYIRLDVDLFKAQYTCHPGFKFANGDLTVTCNAERRWESHGTFVDEFECEQIRCPPPPDIAKAVLNSSNVDVFTINSTAYYTCVDGSKLVGLQPLLSCTEDATWSVAFFECRKIDCGKPPPIPNAQVSFDGGTGEGAVALYTCESDYTLVSKRNNRTCGPDGLWTSEFIECLSSGVEHCGDPPPVEFATVSLQSAVRGSLAIYDCQEGYRHTWSNIMECSNISESWTAIPIVNCAPMDCGWPPEIVNTDSMLHAGTTFGSTVSYHCSNRPNSDATNAICSSEGSWVLDAPVECHFQETVTCGPPPYVLNSVMTYDSTTVASVASYSCDPGYKGAPFEAHCDPSGVWNLQEPNGCLPVECGPIPIVESIESVQTSSNTYGGVAAYQCPPGYIHTGPSLKTCQVDQEW